MLTRVSLSMAPAIVFVIEVRVELIVAICFVAAGRMSRELRQSSTNVIVRLIGAVRLRAKSVVVYKKLLVVDDGLFFRFLFFCLRDRTIFVYNFSLEA